MNNNSRTYLSVIFIIFLTVLISGVFQKKDIRESAQTKQEESRLEDASEIKDYLENFVVQELDDDWKKYQHDQLDFTFQLPATWKIGYVQFEKGGFSITALRPRETPLPENRYELITELDKYKDELRRNYKYGLSIKGYNDEYEYNPRGMYPENYFLKTWKDNIDQFCMKNKCETSNPYVLSRYFASKGGDSHLAIDGYTSISKFYPIIYFEATTQEILDDLSQKMDTGWQEAYRLLYDNQSDLKAFIYSQSLAPEILDDLKNIDQILNSVTLINTKTL